MAVRVPQNSIGHWVIRALWVAAVAAFVLYIPTRTETGTIGDMTVAIEFAIAAISLNLVLGYTGIISLGHSAFFGVGMFTTAVMVDRYGWSQGWTFFIAFAVAFIVGCLVSLPALRLTGIYLALVTLALAVLFPTLMKWNKLEWLTGGSRGITGIGYEDVPTWPLLGELKGRDGRAVFLYWLGIVLLVVTYAIARGIVKSRAGRSLVAIRDNEIAASVMGVHTARTKTLIFGISAGMCALAGSLSAIRLDAANPDVPTVTLIGSITFLLMMILGGTATLWGPIIGALLFVVIDTRTREAGASGTGVINKVFNDWMNFTTSPAGFILAVIILVMIFVAPFGVVGLLRRLASKLVVIVPRPAGTPAAAGDVLAPAAAAEVVEGAGADAVVVSGDAND